MRLALEPLGHRIVEAGDGETGILLALSSRPDLVIVDLSLPDRSGIDVVRSLRQEPGLEATPILMATGSVQPGDRSAAEAAGVNAFIHKPFSITYLVAEIERLLTRGSSNDSPLPLRRLQ